MRPTISLLLGLGLAAFGAPDPAASSAPTAKSKESPPAKEIKETTPAKTADPVVREFAVGINGKNVPYKVTTGKIQLKHDDGKAKASIFHISYVRTDAKEVSKRPVLFAFNGGPGSAAVWLHIGMLGPKIIKLPDNGTTAPVPPAHVEDNPLSILDVCDLVFVDPVSTGYSRAENDTKPGEFHGLNEDIESVGDFIRRWISEHERWASPKYLLGESYGGIRAAGLAHHLQSRYGMSLNGVVLLSSLLDFATLQTSSGNDLCFMVYLPSFTGVAHYHKKIKGDLNALIKESTEFAFGAYAAALIQGNTLDPATRAAVAAKLGHFTGIPAAIWVTHDLRIDPGLFRG